MFFTRYDIICDLLQYRSTKIAKIDELTLFLSCRQPSVVADIEDGLVSINGYNIFRKDRPSRRGEGICVYSPHGTYAKRRLDLEHENLECLWLWLRPTRLPRPLSGIAVCIVYHLPGLPVKNHHQLNEYLGADYMSRASPANRADAILSPLIGA